jgi:putative addiction module component (TIGR02574 family)
MTAKTKKLLDEALQLPSQEREALAGQLFDSLEAEDPNVESAWQTEIEKRMAELDQRKVRTLTWTEAREVIFGDAGPKSYLPKQ